MSTVMKTAKERFETKWGDVYPGLGTGPISTERYISEEHWQRERVEIFGKLWLQVGREHEIAEPGQYFVVRIASNDADVIISRGRDGKIRAFYNICSHRGAAVTQKDRGQCRAFRCGFHGWNFGLDGSLRGVPDEADFECFDKAANGLTQVHVDTWESFIFINLAKGAVENLQSYLGQLGKDLAGHPFHEATGCYQYLIPVRANWKLALDSFQDLYHGPFLHHASGDNLPGPDNPFLHALDITLDKRHRALSVPRNPEHIPTQMESLAGRYGQYMYSKRKDGAKREPAAGVNRTRSDRWAFDINVFFPQFFCAVTEGSFYTFMFWPQSRNETLIDFRMYYPQATTARDWISQEYSRIRLRDTVFEDLDTIEAAQRGMESRSRDFINLKDQEIPIRHGHKVVEDVIHFYQRVS